MYFDIITNFLYVLVTFNLMLHCYFLGEFILRSQFHLRSFFCLLVFNALLNCSPSTLHVESVYVQFCEHLLSVLSHLLEV